MKKETRAFNFEIRAEQNEDHGHFLAGQPIVYNSITDMGAWNEVIEAGALDSTDLRDVRFLVNHDTSMIPLARSRRNNENSTMRMTIGEAGMDIRVDLDVENNSEAKALYSATQRGDISGMSFMFTVGADDWSDLDTEHPTRHIRGIDRVYEVSAVTFPAYEATSLEARSAGAESLERAKAALESARAEQAERERRAEILKKLEVFD